MTDLVLQCPACGVTSTLGSAQLASQGKAAAAAVTDAETARRFRSACRVVIRACLPEPMWRLPLAGVDRLSDKIANELGQRVGRIIFGAEE